MITVEKLGSEQFKLDYGLRYAYVAGAMAKAIASKELVIRMGQAGYLGFYGAGGMPLQAVETAIVHIQQILCHGEAYGMNLLSNQSRPKQEMQTVDLFLRYGVHNLEASAYLQITPALVKFRLTGVSTDARGNLIVPNRVIAKISRPEVAQLFLAPAPEQIVSRLLEQGQISGQEAALSRQLPVASDLCVEADSGGHTDMGVTSVLLPTIIRLRDSLQQQHQYHKSVRVGSAGGIGTPESAACAFMLGADFIVTGSINQCTVEAGTSDTVKDMLQGINIQDTAYAPAGDMFELGAKIQVMKKGVFFPARANKLYDLWRNYGSLELIDASVRKEIQDKYFRRSFDEVYRETKDYYMQEFPEEIEKAERNPKVMMALVFRWYFVHTMRLALEGGSEQRVDYQVHTGPAVGAFNQWVQGTSLEDWRNRHVDVIGEHLMQASADYMNRRFQVFL
ncbi:MAG: PfaD family polyunsaturated fatty acid/polyketide biosynthesis protein [Methylobacter sp.]|jgi:trans-AT polyketide synthase/acyltransferase/oxidoreductase domain-containing protein|nr:PfaD family polyunsaturated fatty acid/polyketide biosynthesis protein [Methylobacter sp.]